MRFVQEAKKYACEIKASNQDRPEVDAKSILGILSLGAVQGTILQVRAEGPDADRALESLLDLSRINFGEKE